MFKSESTQKDNIKVILLFVAVLIVAYLPVSSFQFCLKNDAFTGYFPPKFFMSECIKSGNLPLWNPYINFGIPQYGDMSSGFWSPITWLIASTIGYNAYSFTLELLLYILLGGLGIYKLLSYWNIDKRIKLITGISFMCCGYNIGNLQHFNWVAGAAFLPWCLWAYLTFLYLPTFKNCIRAAFLFYILVATAHPGISIAAFYVMLSIFIFNYLQNKNAIKLTIQKIVTPHILLIMFFCIFSIGMILGYLDIIPFFSRGQQLDVSNTILNPTTPQSWMSVLLPLATTKNIALFDTDMSMRNIYFGITLFLFFVLAIFNKKTIWQKFFFIVGIFFLLLATGGFFKIILQKIMPGIGFVRLNGEFRIFAMVSFIIIGAVELNKYFKNQIEFKPILKYIITTFKLLLILAIFFGFSKMLLIKDGFIFHINDIKLESGIVQKLKKLIDVLSFYDCLWIQGFIQLIFLHKIGICLRKRDFNSLNKIIIAELIIACLLNLPFTGVGKNNVQSVQACLNKSPIGIPIPQPMPIYQIDTCSYYQRGLIGNWSFYNKQIGTTIMAPYPILLKNTEVYFDEKLVNNTFSADSNSYLFVINKSTDTSLFHRKTNSNGKINVLFFEPNKIKATIFVDTASEVVYLQNNYPHWFYQANNNAGKPTTAGINFMKGPLVKGNNTIEFVFEPTFIKWLLLFNLLTIFLVLLFFIYIKFR